MQSQFDNVLQKVTGLLNELAATRNELALTQKNLISDQSSSSLKHKKPDSFIGKGSLES